MRRGLFQGMPMLSQPLSRLLWIVKMKRHSKRRVSSLMTRIDTSIVQVKNLHPSAYTLKDLDEELICMTMIRALSSSYANLALSLQLLDQMTKDEVQHVSNLDSNLLYLVQQHKFHVHIDSNYMAFALKGHTLTAPIGRSNTAYLARTIIPPQAYLCLPVQLSHSSICAFSPCRHSEKYL